MQGGAADELVRLRSGVDAVTKCCDKRQQEEEAAAVKKKRQQEQVTPPIDTLTVGQEIVISPAVDALLDASREWFALALATPIAWLHLDINVVACRERKLSRVREGSCVVVDIQRRCRTAWGDFYFSFWSFFAEEEFYLLALPVLFWNVDYRFARHMTLIVCFGLLWGNLMKDVFRLPRPRNVESEVWVPPSAKRMDSTACRDFGFPSTHAMNSVSNALYLVMYCHQYGLGGKPVSYVVLFIGAVVWICSITFGRLYLGVHSPMDVKGGLLLGTALVIIFHNIVDVVDRWVLAGPHVGVLLMLIIAVVLILNPQPRPMTPTFMQNCVISGLTWGCTVGYRMETDRRHGRGILGFGVSTHENGFSHKGSNDIGLGLCVLRTAMGYVMVLMTRVVLKKIMVAIFHKVGLEPNPVKQPTSPVGSDQQPDLKGWDLWAAAVVKTGVYAALAWSITCGCPAFFEVIGLPSEMNG